MQYLYKADRVPRVPVKVGCLRVLLSKSHFNLLCACAVYAYVHTHMYFKGGCLLRKRMR